MLRRSVATALLALAATVALVLGVAAVPPASTAPAAAAAAYTGPRAGMVQMFDWPWPDIARECTNHLGPKGYWAVQTSPPKEHARVSGDPWWERYQPVSYRLDSRSGDRAEFAAMVATCRDAGVTIIADVVLNHMAGTDGVSIIGTQYQKYQYSIYSPQDFHQPPCQVTNYNDRYNVQFCELVSLSDLNTASSYVRGQQVAYLNDLVSLGSGGSGWTPPSTSPPPTWLRSSGR